MNLKLNLGDDLGYTTGTNGTSTFTDSKAEAFFHSDRLDQFNGHFGGVTWHNHFGTFWQGDNTGYVSGTEVELWTVVRVERVVTATFVFGQNVDVCFELGVRGDRAWGYDNLTTLYVVTTQTTQ